MKSGGTHSDYRDLLRQEFFRLSSKSGGAFTLSAFARQLGLSVSFTSQLLNRHAHLSPSRALKVTQVLRWRQDKRKYFLTLVEATTARLASRRQVARERLTPAAQRSYSPELLENLRWIHFAIAELPNTQGFGGTFQDFLARFPMNEQTMSGILQTLCDCGFLQKEGDTWNCRRPENEIVSSIPSKVVRTYHCDLLDRAKLALETEAIEERQFDNFVMAFDSSRMAEAKRALFEFQKTFNRRFSTKTSDTVYCLGTQLFRIDEGHKK